MTLPEPENVTQLLIAWAQGDEAARDELIPLVYDTLRSIARRRLRGERAGHTLQTTELKRRLKSWESRLPLSNADGAPPAPGCKRS